MSKDEIHANRNKIKKIKKINKKLKEMKKSDSVELNLKQREMYESWNRLVEGNKRGFANIAHPYSDEKDYLIKELNAEKNIRESFLIKLICEEKGHVSGGGGSVIINGSYVSEICKRCHSPYQRPLSQRENTDWHKLMTTPMDI